MADFEEAYQITLGNEGGYDNDPDDAGGETYKGVARRYWPNWKGWRIVDAGKDETTFPANLERIGVLQDLVKEHYKEQFWNPFWGDDISNQSVANELFDTGVNMGISRAVKFLQVGLNVLNRNGKLYADIVDDGDFGTNTFNALNSYLAQDDPDLLYKVINILQGNHYIEYMKKSSIQEKYARGWFKRVSFIKN